jgi:hypothetical protein
MSITTICCSTCFSKKSGSERSLSSPVLYPRGADEAPAQQDGQQSWLVAVDSVGARCTASFGKKQNTIKASLMLVFLSFRCWLFANNQPVTFVS